LAAIADSSGTQFRGQSVIAGLDPTIPLGKDCALNRDHRDKRGDEQKLHRQIIVLPRRHPPAVEFSAPVRGDDGADEEE
jgi:hypothetical protein